MHFSTYSPRALFRFFVVSPFQSPRSASRLATLVLAFAALGFVPAVQANTITVNSLSDTLNNADGVCTIREAIINANDNAATWSNCAAGSGADVINLPAGTITFTVANSPGPFNEEHFALRGDLDIRDSVTINGHASGTTIDAADLDRIFDINPVDDPPLPGAIVVVALHRLTITNGQINSDGGGIRIQQNTTTVTIDDSTISNNNITVNDGGGIANFGGTLTMTNCTISGNHAELLVGGIRNDGTATLTNCTVTNNTCLISRGQGIGNFGPAFNLRNTIVAGNGPDNAGQGEGSFISLGYNIFGRPDDNNGDQIMEVTPGVGDQFNVSAVQVNLGPLQNNGGPTPTHATLVGSPAIDKGHSSGSTADQRGRTRPCDDPAIANPILGDGADVGAFELQTVCAANADPDAVDDTAIVAEDSGASAIDVLANDLDADSDTLTVAAVTQGSHGSVLITGGGTGLSYTPELNYFGPDSFTYTISDGNGGSDTATVSVTVTNVNDHPDAVNDSANVTEDSGGNTIDVLANDADIDGDPLVVSSVDQGAHGTVVNNGSSVSYTPAPNYFGPDSFTYMISDGQGGSDEATVNVSVTNVNDAPTATPDSYNANSNAQLSVPAPGVLGNDTDIDGGPLTAQLVTGPSHAASFALNPDGSFAYKSVSNFNGTDTFTYRAFDGSAASNLATVTINVTKLVDNVPPVLTASVAKNTLWPANHELVNVGLSVSVSDNSGKPVITKVFVFSDEDDLAPDSGRFSPDAKNIAPGTLRLRAERSGSGDGRVYLILVLAIDYRGNISHTCLTVVVPKSQSQHSLNHVNRQAESAMALCTGAGLPRSRYYLIGNGPRVGPKQ